MEEKIEYIDKETKNRKKKVALILLLLLLLLFILINYAESTTNLIEQELGIPDSNSPTIILDEENVYQMEVNGKIPTILAKAKDNIDANSQISIDINVDTSDVNPNEVGTYIVIITATDDNGNTTTQEVVLEVVDTIAPTIVLNGDNLVYHQMNTEYVDQGVIVTDNYDSVEDIQISITNTVDENILGTYTVTYVATDTSGNVSETVTRTVVVVNNIIVVLPKGNVNYSTLDITTEPVTATLTTNKEIETPTDWTKIDKLTYVKTYTENITETITITDLDGNTGTVSIIIENIEKNLGVLDENWNSIKGVNKPNISSEMIPIKWNGSNWVVCSTDDLEWYDYIEQADGIDGTSKWANVMLSDGTYTSSSVTVGQVIQVSQLRKYVCVDTEI